MKLKILIPACIIGAVLALAIGYVSYTASRWAGSNFDFFVWIDRRPRDVLSWMIGGIVIAAAITFLRRGNSN